MPNIVDLTAYKRSKSIVSYMLDNSPVLKMAITAQTLTTILRAYGLKNAAVIAIDGVFIVGTGLSWSSHLWLMLTKGRTFKKSIKLVLAQLDVVPAEVIVTRHFEKLTAEKIQKLVKESVAASKAI